MGIYRLKRKTFGFLGGLTGFSNFNTAMRAGNIAANTKHAALAKNMGNLATKQAAIGTLKLGGTALAVGGTISAAKKLTGEE